MTSERRGQSHFTALTNPETGASFLGPPAVWHAGPLRLQVLVGLGVLLGCGSAIRQTRGVRAGRDLKIRHSAFTLEQWFSEWGPWTSSTCITWLEMQTDLVNEKLWAEVICF